MAEGLIVYFVTHGPSRFVTENGNVIYTNKAIASIDKGETCGPMVFNFEEEEQAIQFKRDVNYTMELTILGEEE